MFLPAWKYPREQKDVRIPDNYEKGIQFKFTSIWKYQDVKISFLTLQILDKLSI